MILWLDVGLSFLCEFNNSSLCFCVLSRLFLKIWTWPKWVSARPLQTNLWMLKKMRSKMVSCNTSRYTKVVSWNCFEINEINSSLSGNIEEGPSVEMLNVSPKANPGLSIFLFQQILCQSQYRIQICFLFLCQNLPFSSRKSLQVPRKQ